MVVIILAIVAYFVLPKPAADMDIQIQLTASSDKATYKTGEEINLTANLLNSGQYKVCVSDMSAGNIRFTSLSRDSQLVEMRSAPSYFITSLSEILKSNLVEISPGESLDITFASQADAGLGKQALKTTALDDGRGLSTFYDVETPGDYAVELVYEYAGPESSDCSLIFSGATNSATVNFKVTP